MLLLLLILLLSFVIIIINITNMTIIVMVITTIRLQGYLDVERVQIQSSFCIQLPHALLLLGVAKIVELHPNVRRAVSAEPAQTVVMTTQVTILVQPKQLQVPVSGKNRTGCCPERTVLHVQVLILGCSGAFFPHDAPTLTHSRLCARIT